MIGKVLTLAGMVWVLGMVCGCQPFMVEGELTGELAGGDDSSQMDFWHGLAERRVVSHDEAFHALLLYFDGEDESENYEQRVAKLKEYGAIGEGFDKPATEVIDYGDLAVVLVHGMEIKGGVMLQLFKHSPRYASRELRYLGIYPPSTPNQVMSGSDFVAMMGVVEDYQRLHGEGGFVSRRVGEMEQEVVDREVIEKGDEEEKVEVK